MTKPTKILCKNCNHVLDTYDKDTSFLKKYKTLRNGFTHKRHVTLGFTPIRECHCGCLKPELGKFKIKITPLTKEILNAFPKMDNIM